MTDFDIKPTTRADIPALQVVLDLTGLFPRDMLPDMIAPSLDGQSDAFWLKVHLDDTAVGFCYTAPEDLTDGTWNMLALAVHPGLHGKKLGGALVSATEARLKANKQRILIVDTSGTEDFASTRAFYKHHGYEEEARIRDYWAAGDDKVIFRKAL